MIIQRGVGQVNGKARPRRSEFQIATPTGPDQSSPMMKLAIFVGTMLGGYLGWWAGEAFGLGFGWAFVLSGIGSMAGVYAGWKLAQKLAE